MNNYEKAAIAIRDRRREQLDRAQIAFDEALRNNDGLYAAFKTYQADMIKNARGESNSLKNSRAEFDKALADAGISPDSFDPPPSCPICNDTGMHGNMYCKCVINNVIQSDKANLTLPAVDFDQAKKTAPAAIKAAYTSAENFISDGKPFFILLGSAGTGKTILAAAIASEFMKRGGSAVTLTAFDFVRRALDYHTQFKIENYVDRFTPMLDCDLLVIDDLGKETSLKNVTNEYLYAVINERWLHKKKTVVTSNLTPEAALSRYGESIASRLFDKNSAYAFIVKGKNSRLK